MSNLELDQTQKEQKIKIEELTDLLATEKLKNQDLAQQLQSLQIENDEQNHNFQEQLYKLQQYIDSLQRQILNQSNIINLQEYKLKEMTYYNTSNLDNNNNNDDEFDKYDIKFDDDEVLFYLDIHRIFARIRIIKLNMNRMKTLEIQKKIQNKLKNYDIDYWRNKCVMNN